MLKDDFGWLKVSEISACDVQTRFNALYGSNTKPKNVFERASLEKLVNQNVYFDKLDYVDDSQKLESMTNGQAEAGCVFWDKKEKDYCFIKCKDG